MDLTNDSDDDFDIIPTKICKLDYDDRSQAETCVICLELYTVCGDHRLVSLKCGHTFGQKCIYAWLTNQSSVCPNCKAHATRNDIRPIFIDIATLKMEDNSELVKTTEKLEQVKMKLRETELECSHLTSKCGAFTADNKKLRDEIEIWKQRSLLMEHQISKSDDISTKTEFSFKIVNKILISAEGDCRVMAFSDLNNLLCVSSPSTNALYPGFGVRQISVRHGKLLKFLHLHTKAIRDIAFSQFNSSDIMLTAGLDKFVKLTSLKVEKTVSSYMCQAPVWSCSWSNNNYVFFAGLANGAIEEIDTRKMTTPISTIWQQTGGPVLSLRYIAGNKHIDNNGLLVTNSQNVLFIGKSQLAVDGLISDDSEVSPRISSLVVASEYGGSFIHTSFNERTCHLLNTFRPALHNSGQFLVSQLGSSQFNDVSTIYASDTKSFFGGKKKDFMHRSCFLDDNGSANYVVCPDEGSASINVWDTGSIKECVTLYPKDVTAKKPILDVCQFNSSPLSFAAINCNNLYLYTE